MRSALHVVRRAAALGGAAVIVLGALTTAGHGGLESTAGAAPAAAHRSAPTFKPSTATPSTTKAWPRSPRGPSSPVTLKETASTLHVVKSREESRASADPGAAHAATPGLDTTGTAASTVRQETSGSAPPVATNGSGAAGGSWSALPSLPVPRAGFATVATTGGENAVIVLGGTSTATGQPTATVTALSDATGTWTWTPEPKLPVPVRLASATIDNDFSHQLFGITGSPSTGEQLVVFVCVQTGTGCSWRQEGSSETLGHVTVTSITAVRRCVGKTYHCPDNGDNVHLSYLGCSSGSWYDGGGGTGAAPNESDPGLDPTRAGALVVPWRFPVQFQLGGVASSSAGQSCTPSPSSPEDTVLREDVGTDQTGVYENTSISQLPNAPFTVDQLGSSPAVGVAVPFAPPGMPKTSLGFTAPEAELFVAKSPTAGQTSSPFYDVGSTPPTGEWEQDPSVPIGCSGSTCPVLEALVNTTTPTASWASLADAPLVAIASNGQAALFTSGSPSTPVGSQGTTPSPVPEPLAITLHLETGATGTVTSTPPGIDCPGSCSAKFTEGKSVTLTATPGAAADFFETFSVTTTGIPAAYACGNPCTFPPSSFPGYQTLIATFSPFKATVGAWAGSPTGTDLVQVRLTDCEPHVGVSTWTVSGPGGGAKKDDDSTCVFVTTLLPGTYTVSLQATSTTGSLVVDATADLGVRASVEFQYYVGPSTSSKVPVTFNACKLSSGISTYEWSADGGAPQAADCDVELTMTTGTHKVTLTGVDPSGRTATTTATIDVIQYSPPSASSSACSDLSLGKTACWRHYVTWTGDVLSGHARYPDYAMFVVSAAAAGIVGSVPTILSCSGNMFGGVGVSLSLGVDDLGDVQAMAGWGWRGDPASPEPLARTVDTFITGWTGIDGINDLIVGLNWTHSTTGFDGIEYYLSTPGLGISAGIGYAYRLTPYTKPPATAHCGPMGVLGTPFFQELANIPNLPNDGFMVMQPASTTSTPVVVGGTTTVYVTDSSWAPGSKVTIGVHAVDPATYDLGTATADDTGTIGEPVTLPNLPPGKYQVVLKGFTATLAPQTETVPFTVPGATATAPSAPTGVTAVAGNQSATVSWTAPTTGGTPITSYTVTATTGKKTCAPASAASTACTVATLTNGVPYTFTVVARNGVGPSAASTASEPVTPEPPPPPAPAGVSAQAATASVTLRWSASAGATSYDVYDSTTPTIPTTGTPACTAQSTTCTVRKLSNGTRYYFVVVAVNAGGRSAPSSPAVTAIPEPPPTRPVVVDVGYSTPANTALHVSSAKGVLSVDTLHGATIVAWTQPQHGTLHGTPSGAFTYTPARGFTGLDRFTYTVGNAAGSATATVTVQVGEDVSNLSVQLHAPLVVLRGATFTYTLAVRDLGPDQALWVTTSFTLPDGVSLLTAGGGHVAGNQITWTLPVLASGSTVTYTVTVKAANGVLLVAGAQSWPSTSQDPTRFTDKAIALTLVL